MELKVFVRVGALIIAIWFVGIALGYVPGIELGPLSGAIFAIGAVTFMGTLRAGADMRTAIAASFVMVYFAVLAALATSGMNREQIDNAVGEQLWENFSYLVGVIVVFYFGASAAVEVTRSIHGASRKTEAAESDQPSETSGEDAK